MHTVKIAHISDMHLGSAFSSLPYDKSKLRSKELVYTCQKAMKDCSDCDILLLSGDIFDKGNIAYSLADEFLASIKELSDTRVFLSCGNHDSYYTDIIKYCLKNSPDNLHIFSPDEISYITLDHISTRVYGASFSAEHRFSSLLDKMPVCDENYINILCMHGDPFSDQYNPFDINDLSRCKLDYAALGHIHKFSGIERTGECFYAYSGSTEGRGFDECGSKGYIKGEIYKSGHKLKFVHCSRRAYIDETIDITDFKSENDLIDVIRSVGLSNDNVCRFNLVGFNNFGKPLDMNFIESQCNYFYCTFYDNTKINVSLDELCDYPGLLGSCALETKSRIDSSANSDDTEKWKKAFEILRNKLENR